MATIKLTYMLLVAVMSAVSGLHGEIKGFGESEYLLLYTSYRLVITEFCGKQMRDEFVKIMSTKGNCCNSSWLLFDNSL